MKKFGHILHIESGQHTIFLIKKYDNVLDRLNQVKVRIVANMAQRVRAPRRG